MKVAVDFTNLSDDEYQNNIEIIRKRYYHCKHRASERYRVKINQDDYFQLVDQIITGEALFLMECDFLDGRFLYEVSFKGRQMLAVYDYDTGTICTFLNDEIFQKLKMRWERK